MIQKILYYFIVTITILFYGCSKESNPLYGTDDIVYSDQELFSRVSQYSFRDSTYSISYATDSTFIENYHEIFITPLPHSFVFDIKYERRGKYKIEKGMLIYYQVHVNLDTSRFLNGPDHYQSISIELLNKRIKFNKNQIEFSPVYIFENPEQKVNILGYWSTITWRCSFQSYPNNVIYSQGRVELYYRFYNVDSTYSWGENYPDGQPYTTFESQSKYKYESPVLTFLISNTIYLVSLNSQIMYWFPFESTQLSKRLSPLDSETIVGENFSAWFYKAGSLFRLDLQKNNIKQK